MFSQDFLALSRLLLACIELVSIILMRSLQSSSVETLILYAIPELYPSGRVKMLN